MQAEERSAKEAFVSGGQGASLPHVVAACLLVPLAHLCASAVTSRAPASLSWLIDWALRLLAFTLTLTVGYTHWLHVWVPCTALLLLLLLCVLPPPPSSSSSSVTSVSPLHGHLPLLASYRASLMLATCVAILAVDFPLFHRHLAKTESFGFSLMDFGVGSFVLVLGMVSRLAWRRHPPASSSSASAHHWVRRAVLSVVVLGSVGGVRAWATRVVNYQLHLSEYGQHWNFFLTLALLMVVDSAAGALRPPLPSWALFACGLLVSLVHEVLLLGVLGGQQFVLGPDREGWVAANKEGILSLPGYLSLYLFGAWIGSQVRLFYATVLHKKDHRVAVLKAVAWVAVVCVVTFSVAQVWRPSRRLINLPFVALSVGLTLLMLLVSGLPGAWSGCMDSAPSGLVESINRNIMVVFLVANVSTGLVNLLVPTLLVSDLVALAILALYGAWLVLVSWLLSTLGCSISIRGGGAQQDPASEKKGQ